MLDKWHQRLHWFLIFWTVTWQTKMESRWVVTSVCQPSAWCARVIRTNFVNKSIKSLVMLLFANFLNYKLLGKTAFLNIKNGTFAIEIHWLVGSATDCTLQATATSTPYIFHIYRMMAQWPECRWQSKTHSSLTPLDLFDTCTVSADVAESNTNHTHYLHSPTTATNTALSNFV